MFLDKFCKALNSSSNKLCERFEKNMEKYVGYILNCCKLQLIFRNKKSFLIFSDLKFVLFMNTRVVDAIVVDT